jgi:nucleotide-binding universal stress UspA family protein
MPARDGMAVLNKWQPDMMKRPTLFQSLLAATVAGPGTDGAVLTAARLAARHHARLCIVHAVALPRSAGGDGKSAPDQTPPNRMAADDSIAESLRLHALYAPHCPSLAPEDVRIVWGVAWEAVSHVAEELGCDLIVMGPHSRSPDTGLAPKTKRFLGSTADGVICRSRCPVLIANGPFDNAKLDFKTIVVGVDFSGSCTAAVGLAALFAKHCGAFVSTFHMLPVPPYPKYSPKTLQADLERQQKRMNALCGQLLKGTRHQPVLKPGVQPHAEILQIVEHVGADLIVMGSHTRDRTGKWYAGSVVQRVTRLARCPVIVVNGPDALKPWEWVKPPVSPPTTT